MSAIARRGGSHPTHHACPLLPPTRQFFQNLTNRGGPPTIHPMKQRKLCEAENNSCTNLAENKGRTRTGDIKYGRFCDSHRRKHHKAASVPSQSKRFVPLDGCEMCLTSPASDRHRIVPGSEYGPERVVGLCKKCHQSIHRFYTRITELGYGVSLSQNHNL